MKIHETNGTHLHWREDGDPDGTPLVFANSLGSDLRLWDPILPLLPPGLRIIRYDKRGHGLSGIGAPPYSMDLLIDDAASLLDALGLRDTIFVGLSIGGVIGQGLAARRPDLIKALVLSNSAPRMGTPEMWAERIAAVQAGGMEAIADTIIARWFGKAFLARPEATLWRAMLARTPAAGYLGCCAALADADLTGTTRDLRLPAMAIAGEEDMTSPPEMVAATAALIADAPCHVIPKVGHLPCVEDPRAFADILNPFLKGQQDA